MDIWRRIFEFDFQLEMYKLVAERRWVLRIADLARRPAARTAHQQGLSGHPAFRTCPGRDRGS
jgi:hypothetical protein